MFGTIGVCNGRTKLENNIALHLLGIRSGRSDSELYLVQKFRF